VPVPEKQVEAPIPFAPKVSTKKLVIPDYNGPADSPIAPEKVHYYTAEEKKMLF